MNSSDISEGRISQTALSFTNANWNVPRRVTVTGLNDFDDDGDVAYRIVFGAAVSAVPKYAGRKPADLALVNIDDDLPPRPSTLPASGLVARPSTTLQATMAAP